MTVVEISREHVGPKQETFLLLIEESDAVGPRR